MWQCNSAAGMQGRKEIFTKIQLPTPNPRTLLATVFKRAKGTLEGTDREGEGETKGTQRGCYMICDLDHNLCPRSPNGRTKERRRSERVVLLLALPPTRRPTAAAANI